MNTGENTQALRGILDMTRLISVSLLGLHGYYYGYQAFQGWQLTHPITDRLLRHIAQTGLFDTLATSKLLALGFLALSLLGVQGRKDERYSVTAAAVWMGVGLVLYATSPWVFVTAWPTPLLVGTYLGLTGGGYLLLLRGGSQVSRIIQKHWQGEPFNHANETFPQEQRRLPNAYALHFPTDFIYRGKRHRGWINVINPFRGLMVLGMPGAGKSYFVIRHVIQQHLAKGFAMFIYDFKYDDLTRIAYYHYRQQRSPLSFYVLNFDDLSRSHRCNPVAATYLLTLQDADESAETLLLSLNRDWIQRKDFFVSSSFSLLAALLWFLRLYQDGRYCTLPHAIELLHMDYDRLFSVLQRDEDLRKRVSPFVSAYLNNAMEQVEGQLASVKISLAKLVSPTMYYLLSGNDFDLNLNDPARPKIICMGNNPLRSAANGAIVSLYVNRLLKLCNQKGRHPASLVFDEFPTIYLHEMDKTLATARSNQIAVTLALQDLSQLRKDYGKDPADVLFNLTSNVIAGQVTGETARQLSERIGKIVQDRRSYSVNRTDTSFSHAQHLDYALPVSRIATLSSGEFVGLVGDEPGCEIPRKAFHARIRNDHAALAREEKQFTDVPIVRTLGADTLDQTVKRIREEVITLVGDCLDEMQRDPRLQHLLVQKKR